MFTGYLNKHQTHHEKIKKKNSCVKINKTGFLQFERKFILFHREDDSKPLNKTQYLSTPNKCQVQLNKNRVGPVYKS